MSEIPALGSIMHLFLGIDATGLPDLDPSHLCVLTGTDLWVIRKRHHHLYSDGARSGSRADGKHIIHVHRRELTVDIWEGKDRGSQEQDFKRERAEFCGMPSNASFRTSAAESRSKSTPLHRRINAFCVVIAARRVRASRRRKSLRVLPLPEVPQPGVLSPIPKLLRWW